MFKIGEVIFGFLDNNMGEKVDWIFHSFRVGVRDIQTEIASRVDFNNFEVYALLIGGTE